MTSDVAFDGASRSRPPGFSKMLLAADSSFSKMLLAADSSLNSIF